MADRIWVPTAKPDPLKLSLNSPGVVKHPDVAQRTLHGSRLICPRTSAGSHREHLTILLRNGFMLIKSPPCWVKLLRRGEYSVTEGVAKQESEEKL
jgi:hypothetical protein